MCGGPGISDVDHWNEAGVAGALPRVTRPPHYPYSDFIIYHNINRTKSCVFVLKLHLITLLKMGRFSPNCMMIIDDSLVICENQIFTPDKTELFYFKKKG